MTRLAPAMTSARSWSSAPHSPLRPRSLGGWRRSWLVGGLPAPGPPGQPHPEQPVPAAAYRCGRGLGKPRTRGSTRVPPWCDAARQAPGCCPDPTQGGRHGRRRRARLARFFDALPTPVDHLLVTGPGPTPAPLADLDAARRDVEAQLLLPLQVARHAASKVRPGGTLLFMGGTGGRSPAPGLALTAALTAALPALTRNLALELAPVRVNL